MQEIIKKYKVEFDIIPNEIGNASQMCSAGGTNEVHLIPLVSFWHCTRLLNVAVIYLLRFVVYAERLTSGPNICCLSSVQFEQLSAAFSMTNK